MDSENAWVWIALLVLIAVGGGDGCSAGLQRADACEAPSSAVEERRLKRQNG